MSLDNDGSAGLCCREVSTLQYVVGTNVFGAFATIQAFYPLLKVWIAATRAGSVAPCPRR